MLAADIFVNMTADENNGIDIGGVSLRVMREFIWMEFIDNCFLETK